MRVLATLLLAFALSLNGLAASACVEAESDAHAMPAAMADMNPDALADDEMACDCCESEQPADMDCHALCLSTAPVLGAPDVAMRAPLFVDAHPALRDPPDPETLSPSPLRRPPRLQS